MFLSEKIIKNFDASFYEFDVANNFFDAANFSAVAHWLEFQPKFGARIKLFRKFFFLYVIHMATYMKNPLGFHGILKPTHRLYLGFRTSRCLFFFFKVFYIRKSLIRAPNFGWNSNQGLTVWVGYVAILLYISIDRIMYISHTIY